MRKSAHGTPGSPQSPNEQPAQVVHQPVEAVHATSSKQIQGVTDRRRDGCIRSVSDRTEKNERRNSLAV